MINEEKLLAILAQRRSAAFPGCTITYSPPLDTIVVDSTGNVTKKNEDGSFSTASVQRPRTKVQPVRGVNIFVTLPKDADEDTGAQILLDAERRYIEAQPLNGPLTLVYNHRHWERKGDSGLSLLSWTTDILVTGERRALPVDDTPSSAVVRHNGDWAETEALIAAGSSLSALPLAEPVIGNVEFLSGIDYDHTDPYVARIQYLTNYYRTPPVGVHITLLSQRDDIMNTVPGMSVDISDSTDSTTVARTLLKVENAFYTALAEHEGLDHANNVLAIEHTPIVWVAQRDDTLLLNDGSRFLRWIAYFQSESSGLGEKAKLIRSLERRIGFWTVARGDALFLFDRQPHYNYDIAQQTLTVALDYVVGADTDNSKQFLVDALRTLIDKANADFDDVHPGFQTTKRDWFITEMAHGHIELQTKFLYARSHDVANFESHVNIVADLILADLGYIADAEFDTSTCRSATIRVPRSSFVLNASPSTIALELATRAAAYLHAQQAEVFAPITWSCADELADWKADVKFVPADTESDVEESTDV